jgi:predicted 2-oxoglutarate/Fe(II)-dependent dioxygenase YbiX
MGVGWWLFREYLPGSEMSAHSDVYSYVTDDSKPVRPYLTAILYLNDDYVGGEIAFPNDSLSIKPKSGSVVIFKSDTLHEVKPILSGNRYMTQTYIYEKPFSEYQDLKGNKTY